jgi:hypothetical protein
MDIAAYHVATIRAGQYNAHSDNPALSSVAYDQKTFYYDLTDTGATATDFRRFVLGAWEHLDFEDEIDVYEANPGVFSVNLD